MDLTELKKHQDEYPLSPADPEVIPEPTFWPIFTAFGVLLLFWGLITSLILSFVGVVVLAFSISGWISDLNKS
ncbi:MAG TPA: hypothetical protein VE870_13030 [Bacteroidales bacterium]|nr:hypothetical protein [Bacteroidales bacterium]